MTRMMMWVDFPDGTALSPSRKHDGAFSPLVHGAERTDLTQATLWPYRGEDDSERTDEDWKRQISPALVAIMAGAVGVGVAGAIAAPRIKRWWTARASARADRESPTGEARVSGTADVATSSMAESPASSELETTPEETVLIMSSAEWRGRFRAMLLASAFSEEQRRLLRNARIEDAEGTLEEMSAGGDPTPEQVVGRANAMLEANPSAFEEEASTLFSRLFPRQDAGGRDEPAASEGWHDKHTVTG